MPTGQMMKGALNVAYGGDGDHLLVLLHGIGANGLAWQRLIPHLDRHWPGRWIAPDFRGHGRSAKHGPYGYAMHAADIAGLIDDLRPTSVTVVGHSFGGVVAALVASGLFGPQVNNVVAIGVKIEWTAEETSKTFALSQRPSRAFATREEAIARYLKTSGLSGLAEASSETALAGVIDAGDGFHVAVDPGVYSAVGPPAEDVLRLARPPIRLAAGSLDPMVTLDQMQRIDRDATTFAGVGHNAHWEAPEAVFRFLCEVTRPREQT